MSVHNIIMMEQHMIKMATFVELMTMHQQYSEIEHKDAIDGMVARAIQQEIDIRTQH